MKASSPACLALGAVLLAVGVAQAQMPSDPDVSPASFNLADTSTSVGSGEPSALQQVLADSAPTIPAPRYADPAEDDCFTPCCWTFALDGLILQRSSPGPVLARSGDPQSGPATFTAHDFDFDTSGGWRLSALRHGTNGDLELNYLQADGFNATSSAVGDSYLESDREGGHLEATAPWFEYRSRLYSGEINLRRPRNEWLTLLAGIRYVELDEHYTATGLGTGEVVDLVQVSDQTANHLTGFQVGADGLLYQNGRWTLEGITKAGIYYNHAKQSAYQWEAATSEFYSGEASHNVAAFVGELGLTGKCQVTEHMSLRLGYQLMWLDGVATAPAQVTANDFGINGGGTISTVATGNTVFLHGAVLGAEMTW